jgi:hypothetical protein
LWKRSGVCYKPFSALTIPTITQIATFISKFVGVSSEHSDTIKGRIVTIADKEPDYPIFYGIVLTILDLFIAEDVSKLVSLESIKEAIKDTFVKIEDQSVESGT